MIEILKTKCLEFNHIALTKHEGVSGNEYFSTQLLKGSEIELISIQEAVRDGLSIVNIKDCLKQLEDHYNLSPDEIGIVKTEFLLVIVRGQSNTKNVMIELYSLKDKQKLDTSICKDRKMSISLPIVNDDEQLDMTRYQDFKNKTIDIYNPNDALFISRCYTYELDGYDTTINMRRNYLYANKTIQCNNNCTYTGIDENSYAQCDCSELMDDVYSVIIIEYILQSVNHINLDIVTCIGQAFNVVST
jgi:hypothetical protein